MYRLGRMYHHVSHTGTHFIPLHSTLVEEIQRLLQTGVQVPNTHTLAVCTQSSHLIIQHALSNMHTHATAGNTFIAEVTEHIAQFAECKFPVESALNFMFRNESLLVSREKVNGHVYHMLKNGEIRLPKPVGVMG